jgi:septal ring factor EnvC (AmiA/AmiB activator)
MSSDRNRWPAGALTAAAAIGLMFSTSATPAGAIETETETETKTRTKTRTKIDEIGVAAVDPVERVARRELVLSQRASEAALRARASALHAYRLNRRGAARFLGVPEARGKDARATTHALLVFQRYAHEATALRAELARARDDRQALETSASAVEPSPASGAEAADLASPARGTIVARPGVRRDPATSALHRVTGLEILSRLNHPIQAPRDGTVRRVEPLPQGGFAVLIAHDEALVSLLTGLRRVDVSPGEVVARGQALGVCGRNLDGAPMVGFELWKAGSPVDPDALQRDRDRVSRSGDRHPRSGPAPRQRPAGAR